MGRFSSLLFGVAAVVLSATGCGQTDRPPPVAEADGEAYIAAIRPFLPPSGTVEERPVVFVVSLDGVALPLEVQIAVVDAFDDSHDVRFVDSADAALDNEAADEPPLEGGLLIGLDEVSRDTPHSTRIEVYRHRGAVEAHLVTLAVDPEGQWRVDGDEPVAPEVLSDRG